jgi:hypothetical protein
MGSLPRDGLCSRLWRAQVSLICALCSVAFVLGLSLPEQALAAIHPLSVLEGPNNRVLELDGVAMARDGSGGVVYRVQVGGVPHVFVVPFLNGGWGQPVEVDREDQFGASQPAIAAGEGGRLLVVWVQLRNVNTGGVKEYELMSSELQPGAGAFGPATIVDSSVSEPVNGDVRAVSPSIAMAPSGQAYVVYRVITNDCEREDPITSVCGYGKGVQVRVARYDYRTWSSLGAVNRSPQLGMQEPTASNAPSIGIDQAGEGFVAWQEPDATGIQRIWARRLFGSVQGNVLQVSPETISGRAVTSPAEAPVVAMSPFGEARIVFRIRGESGSAVTTTQLYMNSINSTFDLGSALLNGAVAVPGAVGSALGVPSASIDSEGAYRLAWPVGQSVQALLGSTQGMAAPASIGGVSAWLASAPAGPAVDVREDFPQGGFQSGQFGGNIPGPVGDLALGGSGQGDALLGWTVGAPGYSEIVADFIQAPPAPFLVSAPHGWLRAATAEVNWEPAPDAVSGETYTVYVDGKPVLSSLTGLSARLDTQALGSGVHHVRILATDPAGQHTLSNTATLDIDANPPIVKAALIDRGRGVRVRVSDGASGVDGQATLISFGDGSRTHRGAKATHKYRRGGTYTITAYVRDKAGISATVHLRVRVA